MADRQKQAFDPGTFLVKTGDGCTPAKYREDQVLFSQGDPSDAAFFIQKGKVKIVVVSAQGKEAVISVAGPNEFLGEACIAGQLRRTATASAMAESEIIRVDKATMMRVLHEDAAFSEVFVLHTLKHILRVEEDLVDHLFNSSEKRLARALLLIANFGNEGKPEPITTKITHEMLAKMIGTTRSRVSFFMNKFRRLGFIKYNGHLEVRSSLLSVVLGDPSNTVDDQG